MSTAGDVGSGAATGAAIGSMAGPWGTAIGAGAGGLIALGGDLFGESAADKAKRAALMAQGQASGQFANTGEQQFSALGGQLGQQYGYLQDVARGNQSVSAEQLRQSLQQTMAQQQSMAAGAAPQNQAMAALMASRNSMQLGSGLAGQQAIAGIQERQAAQNALMQAMLQQRQQEMQVALQGRSNAIAGYGGAPPGQSFMQQYGGALSGAAQLYATAGGGRAAASAPKPSSGGSYQSSGPSPYGNYA